VEQVNCNYGQWLEWCRGKQGVELSEWAFLLDLETKVYKSIITGDVVPPEEWRQQIFQSVCRATLAGIL
jgi:hypothetical protein